MRLGRFLIVGVAGAAFTPLGYAWGDEVGDLGRKVFDIETHVRDLDKSIKAEGGSDAEMAGRRLVDAQVLYQLKNYDAAATLLMDLVERYPNSASYPEGLFMLGECFYKNRSYLSARRYFEQVVALGPGTPGTPQHRRYQEALQRLIDLALVTEDYTPVDGYLAKLAEVPPASLLPSVPYVRAKYNYFRGRKAEAIASFEQIPQGSPYYYQGRYFIATAKTSEKDYAGAIATLQALTGFYPQQPPPVTDGKDAKAAPAPRPAPAPVNQPKLTDEEHKVQEMSYLAMGRLNYEVGQYPQALEAYQKVPRNSELFADALYEAAWIFIKKKEYEKAYRSLDLLLLAAPNSPQAPEVRILLGNLQVRLGKLPPALNVFQESRDSFDPARVQLDEVLAKEGSGRNYLQELMGKQASVFDVDPLPPLAVSWAKQSTDVSRIVSMASDVETMNRDIQESDHLVRRLERATQPPARVQVFGDLAASQQRALVLANELYSVRQQLATTRQKILNDQAPAELKGRVAELGGELRAVEGRLASLPKTVDGYKERQRKHRGNVEAVERRMSELNVEIQNMTSQVRATQQYFRTGDRKQKTTPAEVQGRTEQQKAVIQELERSRDQLGAELQASREMGFNDSQNEQEMRDRAQYAELIKKQDALTQEASAKVSADGRMKLDQIQSVLSRATTVDASLAAFDGRLDKLADERLAEAHKTLEKEKADMVAVRSNLNTAGTETSALGGKIAYEGFRLVSKQFYDIVVRSDVGLIDVAWAGKQVKTDAAAKAKREMTTELNGLEDQFREILQADR